MIFRGAEAKTTGWVYNPRFLDHAPGASHVERPERLEVIVRSLQQAGLLDQMDALPFSAATAEQLTLVHDPAYVDLLRMMCDDGFTFVGSSDTGINAHSYEVAALAAGGVLAACDAVMAGRVRRAFCAVRPPGTMPKRIKRSDSACSITPRSPPNILFAVINCRGWRSSISTCITATALTWATSAERSSSTYKR